MKLPLRLYQTLWERCNSKSKNLGLGSMYKEMSSLYLIENENILIPEAENLFEMKKDVDMDMAK